jgi:adenosylcobinamide-GDP ribazoletransferase
VATGRIAAARAEFWLALSFLTTLPTPRFDLPPGGLSGAARWFPLVGLILGLLLWGVQALVGLGFAPLLTGALVVVAWAALTGGLHLDGVADCGDGLLATAALTRRLEILRDPRLGSFGGLTLILLILLKTLAISQIALNPAGGVALLLAPVWARFWLLWAARRPQARPDGLGATFAAGLTPAILTFAAGLPLLLLLLGGGRGLLGAALMGLVTWGCVRFAQARLGGMTGDVNGLVVELGELTMLLVYAAQPGRF